MGVFYTHFMDVFTSPYGLGYLVVIILLSHFWPVKHY